MTLALLIDADNAKPSATENLMVEIALLGNACVRRIYGDWTTPNLSGWKNIILNYSIHPVQQFRYTVGKNATDSAMIIDAMDLLYTRRFDGFCLVSSDSDFTRLAARIREEGRAVYGFGERKTPQPFVAACDKFIYTDAEICCTEEKLNVVPEPLAAAVRLSDDELVNFLRKAVVAAADESGWGLLGPVGNNLAKLLPGFDATVYGHAKLSGLFSSMQQWFEIEKRSMSGKSIEAYYVREKKHLAKKTPKPDIITDFINFTKKYREGDSIVRTIASVSWMGILVLLSDNGLKGLIHKSNLPENFTTQFSPGERISVTIKLICKEKYKIELIKSN